MPRIRYVEKKFNRETLSIIRAADGMLQEFAADGLIVTLRQLYYRFVSRDLIPNTEQSYKRLGSIVNDARLGGLLDWEAIEDRARSLISSAHWDSPADIIDACARQFRIDKWSDQHNRVEVWVEKQALESVVGLAAEPLDCAYFACKGYCSQSEMWRASVRFNAFRRDNGKRQHPVVIYLGDHDPSGLDMTRDVEDRLNTIFGVKVEVVRLALNRDQVNEYDPPPNPAKLTDSRASAYVAEHGDESWELDALEPRVLRQLIQDKIREYMDEDRFEAKRDEERRLRETLRAVSANWTAIEKKYAPKS